MRQLLNIELHPYDVFSALNSLTETGARLRHQADARAVFPDVYAVITRRVAAEVKKGEASIFLEPAWIARLAGLFAERYFASLVASLKGTTQSSLAWRLCYEYAQGHALPAREALLGINAHINFDLAQGLYDNIIAAGAAHDERLLARYHHDHDAVNSILAAAIPECLSLLASRYNCPLARLITASESVMNAFCSMILSMLKRWRDGVWLDVRALLDANSEGERAAIVMRMNAESGLIASVFGAVSTVFGRLAEQVRGAISPLRPRAVLPKKTPPALLHHAESFLRNAA